MVSRKSRLARAQKPILNVYDIPTHGGGYSGMSFVGMDVDPAKSAKGTFANKTGIKIVTGQMTREDAAAFVKAKQRSGFTRS